MRQKVSPTSAEATMRGAAKAGGDNGRSDGLPVSAAISNGEDLGPFVRRAFAAGKPETLLSALRHFSRAKESEIEDVCRDHYQDFIAAVDDLRSLLADADSLKSSLSDSNLLLQAVGGPLLSSLDAFLEARSQAQNISLAMASIRRWIGVLELCQRANAHLSNDDLYLALRCVDRIQRDLLVESPTLRRMLEKQIPEIRAHVERKIGKEFGDWLVQIRVISRNLGQIAIGNSSAARQREEELHDIALHDHDDGSSLDLTPLHRAHHIHRTLGLESRFKQYYFENRKLQLTSDFQVSSTSPFLESHQIFFAQIAGFFIVEDRILRTGDGLTTKIDVESLWETAMAKMISVLEDQFSRMQTANHLLLIKDYVSLFAVTLRHYGYSVDPLLEILNKHRDKYHELLLSDCRKQIGEAIAADVFEQMLMRKEYEYSMNVLSFQLQTSEIMPAFPFVAPFSSTVPDCCRIVRSFIEDSVSFMSHGGQLDFYHVVNKYLERLLGEVLDAALSKLVESSVHGVSQAMQVAANMVVLERACDFFSRHAAQLSGIPLRMAEKKGGGEFPLKRSRDAAEELLIGLLRKKIDEFMLLTENINWTADDFSSSGNEYSNEVIIYLETLVSTAQQILPVQVLKRVLRGVLAHISERIVGVFLDESVKRFSESAVSGIDADLKLFESFAEVQMGNSAVGDLREALVEARQLVNLLLSNHPENFLNPVIREKSYNRLDYKKVAAISEKFRDSSDRLFGAFGARALKQNPKKKALDTLVRRLREAY
ncbi:exocyst complex component sec15B [Wolffia australiana]